MTRIIGHRGARNLWPENSLSGFRKTADLNIAGVEFDLHLTNAGEVVVLHDPTLERTTNGIGDVAELSKYARVNTYLRESMDEHIPLFEEVLEIFKPTGMELHVELKNRANGDLYDGLTDTVVQIIRAQGMEDQCILTGFTRQVLEQVKDIAPEMRRLASLNTFSATILGGLQEALDYFDAHADILAVEKALLFHSWDEIIDRIAPERLGVWVPNTEPELAYWKNTPIRQITTDRPDLA